MNTDSPEYWMRESAWLSGIDDVSADTAAKSDASPWYQRLIDTAVPVLASAYMQRELLKLNMARSMQGLPPITAEEFSRTYQPPIARVEVESPNTARLLLIAGAIVVAGILLTRGRE